MDDPFKILSAYDARSMWESARRKGADPAIVDRALRQVPEVTAAEALQANAEAVKLLVGYRWSIMREAREQGSSWADIGEALGVSEQDAITSYTDAIVRQRMYVPEFHDAERSQAALEELPPTDFGV